MKNTTQLRLAASLLALAITSGTAHAQDAAAPNEAADAGVDRSGNWLPVMPGENFMLTTRAYEPKGAIARLEWPGPKVVKTS
jgi:hypothetical protein